MVGREKCHQFRRKLAGRIGLVGLSLNSEIAAHGMHGTH